MLRIYKEPWLDGHESEQALGAGDGQGSLACCSPWGHKQLDTTEWLNWTERTQKLSSKNENNQIRKWVKDTNKHFTAKQLQMTNKSIKWYLNHWTLRKCISKSQWDITIYQIFKTGKIKKYQHQVLTRMWKNQLPHTSRVGNQNDIVTLEPDVCNKSEKHTHHMV